MPNTVVAAKSVHRSSLHRELPVWQRAYVWPFVVGVYPLAGYTAGHWLTADYQFLVWLLAVTVHALAFLACQWSTDVKAWMTCVRVSWRCGWCGRVL